MNAIRTTCRLVYCCAVILTDRQVSVCVSVHARARVQHHSHYLPSLPVVPAVGVYVGAAVGPRVGLAVGLGVGALVGATEGAIEGANVHPQHTGVRDVPII